MGGNTFNRHFYDDDALIELVNYTIDNPLVSIRDHNRRFDTYEQWKADVPRLLDADSSRRFYFLLFTASKSYYCHHCGVELGLSSFFDKPFRFSKYCPVCTAKQIWKREEGFSTEKWIERGKNISIGKRKFFQTERGKEVARSVGQQNAINTANFYKTPYGKEVKIRAAQAQSHTIRSKILEGTVTPKNNNRNTHWESSYKGRRYRSSWEAFYQYLHGDALYEKLRLEYRDADGRKRVYIVDFIDYTNRIVAEVKPRELLDRKTETAKIQALRDWAKSNGFQVVIADAEYLFSHDFPSDLSDFDEHTQHKLIKYYAKTKN